MLLIETVPRGIEPRFICEQARYLTKLEQDFVDELSYRVVKEQQRLTVIYPITIAAFSFLTSSIVTSKNTICIN